MTVWTLDQVQQLHSMTLEESISLDVLAAVFNDKATMSLVADQVLGQYLATTTLMMATAEEEILPDVHLSRLDDDSIDLDVAQSIVRIRARWWPQTTLIQIIGGPHDGTVWDGVKMGVRPPHEPLVIAEETAEPFSYLSEYHYDAPIRSTVRHCRYVCTGWSTASRTWRYEERP